MYKHQTIEFKSSLPAQIIRKDTSFDRSRSELHWHEEMQLIYIDDGKLFVTVGSRETELTSGDVLVINPSEVHAINSGDARFLSVHFSQVFVKSFFEAYESFDYVLKDGSQERREMILLLQKLNAVEQNTFDEYSALVKYSLLVRMLRLLLTRCRCEKRMSIYGTDRSVEDDIAAVKDYIETNYRQKIMTADLEKLMHFRPTYVMTNFKKQTGMCITDYVKMVRTNHALDDYLIHDVPVGEAALKNGFCHYNHFTNACRKYYGASPTAIKKQKRAASVSAPLERTA